MVDGALVCKGQLCGQFVGTGPLEAYPALLPRLLLIGCVADELAGPGKEEVAGDHLKRMAAHLKGSLAGNAKMDEVKVI